MNGRDDSSWRHASGPDGPRNRQVQAKHSPLAVDPEARDAVGPRALPPSRTGARPANTPRAHRHSTRPRARPSGRTRRDERVYTGTGARTDRSARRAEDRKRACGARRVGVTLARTVQKSLRSVIVAEPGSRARSRLCAPVLVWRPAIFAAQNGVIGACLCWSSASSAAWPAPGAAAMVRQQVGLLDPDVAGLEFAVGLGGRAMTASLAGVSSCGPGMAASGRVGDSAA